MIDIFSLCSISFKSAQVLNETVRESIFRNVIALNQIPQELQLIPTKLQSRLYVCPVDGSSQRRRLIRK